MTNDLFSLNGKRAVVVGGASGLGRSMARALAGAGSAVAILDLNLGGAKEAAVELGRLGASSIALSVDVTDYASVDTAIRDAVESLGGLDVAVNAAGIADPRPEDTTPQAVWQRIISVNLTGTYYCCQVESEHMRPRKSGRIVNIASMSSRVVNRFPHELVPESRQLGLFPYCSAKAGIRQLTRVFAAFLAPDGIRVNCVSPGYMRTPLTAGLFEDARMIEVLERDTPVGRIGVPADLDGLVVYLASDSSDFMTGSEVTIDGGFTLW